MEHGLDGQQDERMGVMADQKPDAGWSKLRCDCNSIYFVQVVHIISRSGGGTTTEPAGYMCRQCSGDVDVGRLIHRLELERKKAELRQLEVEVGMAEKEPVPSAKPGKS